MSGAGDIRTYHTFKERGVWFFVFFLLQSQIRFVIAEGYKAKSAKEKGEWGGWSPERTRYKLPRVFSLQGHTRHTSFL